MKLLLVEDDKTTARAVASGLREEGHVVDVCDRCADAEKQASLIAYDVMLLDWGLPDGDGLSLLRTLRDRGLRTPVIMLTARNTVGERVLGIRGGADDYLGKPFDFEELLARIEAVARRSQGQLEQASCAGVVLDGSRRVLRYDGREVGLTPREFGLAAELFRHQGEILSRFRLISAVWGTDFDGDPSVLDVYLGYLRHKLVEVAGDKVQVRNIRGHGFRLVPKEEPQ